MHYPTADIQTEFEINRTIKDQITETSRTTDIFLENKNIIF